MGRKPPVGDLSDFWTSATPHHIYDPKTGKAVWGDLAACRTALRAAGLAYQAMLLKESTGTKSAVDGHRALFIQTYREAPPKAVLDDWIKNCRAMAPKG